MLKNKIITDLLGVQFEEQLDEFLEDLVDYSIQYRPIHIGGGKIEYTALVTYRPLADEKE